MIDFYEATLSSPPISKKQKEKKKNGKKKKNLNVIFLFLVYLSYLTEYPITVDITIKTMPDVNMKGKNKPTSTVRGLSGFCDCFDNRLDSIKRSTA